MNNPQLLDPFLNKLQRDKIQLLTDDTIEEIEKDYTPRQFSADREARHLRQLEEIRQEWLSSQRDNKKSR